MMLFRDDETGLPNPSWNLWEDQRGIHTFTCTTVVAGLRAAARFARLFAEMQRADDYERTAHEITEAIAKHLYSNKANRFLRSIQVESDGRTSPDLTVDASLFGTFYFDVFSSSDPTAWLPQWRPSNLI